MADGSRNGREEGAPADKPMVALECTITSILSRDRDRASSIRKFKGGVGRIGIAIQGKIFKNLLTTISSMI